MSDVDVQGHESWQSYLVEGLISARVAVGSLAREVVHVCDCLRVLVSCSSTGCITAARAFEVQKFHVGSLGFPGVFGEIEDAEQRKKGQPRLQKPAKHTWMQKHHPSCDSKPISCSETFEQWQRHLCTVPCCSLASCFGAPCGWHPKASPAPYLHQGGRAEFFEGPSTTQWPSQGPQDAWAASLWRSC